MLKRQKINQVLKIIMETGQWHGYIVACRVAEWHINHGWHIGCSVGFRLDTIFDVYNSYINPLSNSDKEVVHDILSHIRQDYEWYNCNYELGYYAVFYQEV